ncbi:MAG: NAD(P)/FAD-dependent oxidoreductase [archaeon]
MKKHHSVVIIGAGPAGLMAARALRENNVDFLIIDSKKEIGLPLKCGEGVRQEGFEELFGRKRYDFVKNRSNIFEVTGGRTVRRIKAEYVILDRPRFEQWLAKPIMNDLMLETSYLDVLKKEKKDGEVCLEVRTDKGNIEAEIVIMAAGCDYKLQKRFGLARKNPHLVACYGGIFKADNKDLKTLKFIFDEDNASAIWIFPKDRHTVNVGIGIYHEFTKKDIRLVFDEMVKKFNIKLNGKPSYAGVFPSSGPIKKTYADRLLVCGNAAGQVYAGSGEGIYFSLKAGDIAGRTAAEAVKKKKFSARFLKRYERSWKRSFGHHLRASMYFTAILYLGLKYKKLEQLFAAPGDEELENMFVRGKVPIKAKLVVLVALLSGMFSKDKKELPWLIRKIGRAAMKRRLERQNNRS